MSEARKPPAYQRYPMDTLGYEAGVRLTLAERGLKASIDDAIWLSSDCSVPADPEALALIVRRPLQEVLDALPAVLPCFDSSAIPGRLVEPLLARQMEKLIARRKQLSDAGSEGNRSRWSDGSRDRSSDRTSDGMTDRLVSKAKTNQNQLVGERQFLPEHDDFVREYERNESEPAKGLGHD